jgi:hypothetical protein
MSRWLDPSRQEPGAAPPARLLWFSAGDWSEYEDDASRLAAWHSDRHRWLVEHDGRWPGGQTWLMQSMYASRKPWLTVERAIRNGARGLPSRIGDLSPWDDEDDPEAHEIAWEPCETWLWRPSAADAWPDPWHDAHTSLSRERITRMMGDQ